MFYLLRTIVVICTKHCCNKSTYYCVFETIICWCFMIARMIIMCCKLLLVLKSCILFWGLVWGHSSASTVLGLQICFFFDPQTGFKG
jgi:hypothetical protein